jgi:hypothetical protein
VTIISQGNRCWRGTTTLPGFCWVRGHTDERRAGDSADATKGGPQKKEEAATSRRIPKVARRSMTRYLIGLLLVMGASARPLL